MGFCRLPTRRSRLLLLLLCGGGGGGGAAAASPFETPRRRGVLMPQMPRSVPACAPSICALTLECEAWVRMNVGQACTREVHLVWCCPLR